MSDFWDRLRRALEGPNLSDQWEDTLLLGAALDAAIAPDLDPEYLESFEFKPLIVGLCGGEKILEYNAAGSPHCQPHRYQDGGLWALLRLVGGRLTNGKVFAHLWQAGHEPGHALDLHPLDLDHLCEGLPQEGIWREACAQGLVLANHVSPFLVDPMFFKPFTFNLSLELCGPARLRRLAGLDDGVIRILGGMLANQRRYLSQAALGQALLTKLGVAPNPCEGL